MDDFGLCLEENKEEYDHAIVQQRKRTKLIDTRPVQIDDDEEDDGAERKRSFLFIQ